MNNLLMEGALNSGFNKGTKVVCQIEFLSWELWRRKKTECPEAGGKDKTIESKTAFQLDNSESLWLVCSLSNLFLPLFPG